MRHEILFLNSGRSYVRIEDVWYDVNKEHNPQIGNGFIMGNIEEILDYESYIEAYPESKTELYYVVNDKTQSGGFIRKVSDAKYASGKYSRIVEYGVNPMQPVMIRKQDIDSN